ncbi:hypothetical protein [Halorubrum luteum]
MSPTADSPGITDVVVVVFLAERSFPNEPARSKVCIRAESF